MIYPINSKFHGFSESIELSSLSFYGKRLDALNLSLPISVRPF